jgi:hypothetical protein
MAPTARAPSTEVFVAYADIHSYADIHLYIFIFLAARGGRKF